MAELKWMTDDVPALWQKALQWASSKVNVITYEIQMTDNDSPELFQQLLVIALLVLSTILNYRTSMAIVMHLLSKDKRPP